MNFRDKWGAGARNRRPFKAPMLSQWMLVAVGEARAPSLGRRAEEGLRYVNGQASTS